MSRCEYDGRHGISCDRPATCLIAFYLPGDHGNPLTRHARYFCDQHADDARWGDSDRFDIPIDMSVERSTFTVIGHDRGSIILTVVNAANVSAAREAVEASQSDTWEWRANIDGDIRDLGLGTGDDVEIEVIA